MTDLLPTGWRGRLLALGLALLALFVLYAVAAAPLLEFYRERTALIETRRALLAKLDAVAGELPQLRARLAALRAAADKNTLTLSGSSDAIASAALQGRINALASAAGVTIGSSESLAVHEDGPYRRIGLRVVLSAPFASLIKLLAALETTRPPLVVDALQLHSFRSRPGRAAPAASLNASLEVSGFRVAAAGAAAKP